MLRIRELQSHSVEWLLRNRGDIEVDPVYQRRSKVWTNKDKAFLIDSILNGYDIPKMYLADFTSTKNPWNEKKKRYAVIDGKQRFEAVTEFFDGKLSLSRDFRYLADPALELGGLTYKDVNLKYPELAEKFRNYQLVIMGVITDEMGNINELFIRLNRSKPLVGAEIRNAMLGLVPPTIRRLANHEFFRTRIAFQTGRYQDRNAAAKILLLEFHGQFIDTKKKQLDAFVQDFVEGGMQPKSLKVTGYSCLRVLDHMSAVFIKSDPLLRSQGPLTVYYWFVKKHSSDRKHIRAFLVEFEQRRRENRERASENDPASVDNEMLTFDFLSRSPNDQTSCLRRYAILESRFKVYLHTQSA